MHLPGPLRVLALVVSGLLTVVALGYGVSLALQPRQPLMVSSGPDGTNTSTTAPTLAAAPADLQASASAGVRTLDEGWVSTMATKTGIPAVALRAYANAQLTAPASCHLGWTTLAGIGWVESQHGTLGGRALTESGLPSSPITGIPLGAALDRAYGPMQFIPSTWKTWGADANGDGAADPNNINDAALAAANYLCHSGSLTTGAAWSAAVFSYNHSQTYVQQVYSAAQAYAARAG